MSTFNKISSMFLFKSIGTYEAQSVQDGYLNEDGSVSTSTRRGITDFIEVSNISAIRLLSGFASIADAKFTYAVLYDASKNIISAIKYSTALDDLQADIFIPDGVKYIRLTISSKDISAQYSKLNLTSMSEELNKKITIEKVQSVFDGLSDKGKELSLPSIQDGFFNKDGSILPNTSYNRGITDYLDVSTCSSIIIGSGVSSIANGGNAYGCLYDSNKKFIRALIYGKATEIPESTLVSVLDASFIRLILSDKSIDAKVYIGSIKSLISFKDIIQMSIINSLSLPFGKKDNGYLNSDGSIAENTVADRGVTDFIPVEPNSSIYLKSGAFGTPATGNCYGLIYRNDKSVLSVLSDDKSQEIINRKINIPEDGYYVRFTQQDYNIPVIISFGDNLSLSNDCKNKGKSIGVFGGSLSVNPESETAKSIWKKMLGVTVTTYGVGGAGFSSLQGTSIQQQVDGAAVHDIYILWCSTNDYNGNRECGEWSDYTELDSYDESKLVTQCGGINYCIKKLLEKNPKAEIYLFTSLRFFSSEAGYNPFSESTNGTGKTFSYYVEQQKKCCEHYGISVLDQFNFQCINIFNYTQYYKSDKLHMTEEGYAKIGYQQAQFLANGL